VNESRGVSSPRPRPRPATRGPPRQGGVALEDLQQGPAARPSPRPLLSSTGGLHTGERSNEIRCGFDWAGTCPPTTGPGGHQTGWSPEKRAGCVQVSLGGPTQNDPQCPRDGLGAPGVLDLVLGEGEVRQGVVGAEAGRKAKTEKPTNSHPARCTGGGEPAVRVGTHQGAGKSITFVCWHLSAAPLGAKGIWGGGPDRPALYRQLLPIPRHRVSPGPPPRLKRRVLARRRQPWSAMVFPERRRTCSTVFVRKHRACAMHPSAPGAPTLRRSAGRGLPNGPEWAVSSVCCVNHASCRGLACSAAESGRTA